MTLTDNATFEETATRVDRAIEAVADLDDAGQDVALELKNAVEGFHREALVTIVRTLRDDPRGKELLFSLVDEPEVRAVLAVHGIIRPDPVTRAERALDTVRPYLQSHGGDVELVEVRLPTAVVKLHGSCSGCSMSAVTLRETVESALVENVDEITGIEVLDDEPTAAFIPLGNVGRKDPGWVEGPAVSAVTENALARIDVGDDSFVATLIDGRIAVFRNECVHQGMSLDGGLIADGVITCPWHGFSFDAASGECLTAPGAQLTQVPARVEEGRLWLRAQG